MPLTDNDKSEARDALSLALAFNEPETMIEGLKRLCARKLSEGHMSDSERNRWQDCHGALESVAKELELANAPQAGRVYITGLQPHAMARKLDELQAQDETNAPSEQGEQAQA